MRYLLLGFLLLPSYALAFRTALRSVRRDNVHFYPTINAVTDDKDVDLSNGMDVIYLANVSIAGVDYPVQLDTGSSDLWVKPPGGNLPGSTATSLTYNITYSVGYAAGTIATAPVEFAGFTVSSQALLAVTASNNPVFQFGAAGILGLGFTSLSSVDRKVTASGASWGHSFFDNVFTQNTSQPNYIAFLLERKNGQPTDVDGSFAIGEIDQPYTGIRQTQKISTWPVREPMRWTVLMDGYEYADGVKRTLETKVEDAPSSVILLDTGASYAYAPTDIVNGLYGNVPGASFDTTMGMWNVPCDQEINFSLWIAGRKFNWHPLDVVVPYINNNKTCVGSIIPSNSLNGFDFHAGDVFLRSLYTVLDFGDFDATGNMGDPYVRLWTVVDQPSASAEFHAVRGGTPQPYKSSSSVSANAASDNPDLPTGGTSSSANTTTMADQQDLMRNVNTLVSYAPIMLGVLGLNAVLLVVVVGIMIVYLCRRKRSKKRQAVTPPSLSVPTLSRSHSYHQVKGEDLETPFQTTFDESKAPTKKRQNSVSSSFYGAPNPEDDDVFRMSTFKEDPPPRFSKISHHYPSPSKSTFRGHGPSGLGQSTVPPMEKDPALFNSPTGTADALPSPGLYPGSRSHSPGAESRRVPSNTSSPAIRPEDLPNAEDQSPTIEIPAEGSSRQHEFLASIQNEARTISHESEGGNSSFQHVSLESSRLPTRREGKRATSMTSGEPKPASRRISRGKSREQPQEVESPISTEPPMPPGPSRSQNLAALAAAADGPSQFDGEPLQPPQRRFQDGRKAAFVDSVYGDRTTMYYDAPEGQGDPAPSKQSGLEHIPPLSPLRGTAFAAAQAAGIGSPAPAHTRTGSNISSRSPIGSPNRPGFNLAPRGPSNLAPSSLGPARGPSSSTSGAHGRSGSYNSQSSSLRPMSGAVPRRQASGDSSEMGERKSFEQRAAEGSQDAFSDRASRQTAPKRPFAGSGSRYSSMH
ncbi:hypothetical protein FRB99_006800 [Tulasnella sp. 403]|nr:hypothetical protein FRB99_006800 [Tulasnella sp. 403]